PIAPLCPAGSTEDPSLACYRKCNQCSFNCTWRAAAPSRNATYILTFCYHNTLSCKRFKTGPSTHYSSPYRRMRLLENVTAWVESYSGGRVERTENITLQLEYAIKLDPPDHARLNGKSNGTLNLTLPKPDDPTVKDRRLQRRLKGTQWTQVACQTQDDDKTEKKMICNLGTRAACEVQLRHKTAHWSSYWSTWSKSLVVPEEILASPEVNLTVGRLGRNGRRNVTVHWQSPVSGLPSWTLLSNRDGEISYTLTFDMRACGCKEQERDIVHVKNATTLSVVLSGAEYHVSMGASNSAGSGPLWTYHIPPAHHPAIGFLNVSSAGSSVTVQWAAKTNGTRYCFERQPLENPQEGREECIHKQFFEQDSAAERSVSWFYAPGTVQPKKCYRIAIHGLGPEKHWSTFGSTYHFATNTSLDGPLHIQNITATSAVLHWNLSPVSQCPGILKKFTICHRSEQENRMLYHEANASAMHYALRDLQPSTSYRVGIQAATADRDTPCSPQYPFRTMKLGPNPPEWKVNLRYLGIFLGILILAMFYHFGKKRVKKVLFPLLPSPVDSQALKFPAEEMSQSCQMWQGFVEPSEKVSPTEPLVTEFTSDKGE
uniref:Interleukin 12 receptor subunit beta 1 n=1 Tax=Pelodiscus sinensis TaxID=13735 RepID=K7F297_PELSI